MKNTKKIGRTVLALVTIASIGGSSTAFPKYTSASEVQEYNKNSLAYQNSQQSRAGTGEIINIWDTVEDMVLTIPKVSGPSPIFPPENYHFFFNNDPVTLSGVNIEENNVTNIQPLFLGSNTFYNTSDDTQTYNTSIFSQAITNTTTTTTTKGGSWANSAKGKVGIPFVSEGEISTTLTFNFSDADTNTETKTDTITAPSQPVKVPANKVYKCEVYFEKKSTSGNVEMFADVDGYVFNTWEGKKWPVGKALDWAEDKKGLIKSPNNAEQVRVRGKGEFNIEYGSNLIVKTYEVSPGRNSEKLINTKIVPFK
ncbi:hypothetical protein COD67_21460 [Bacillus cereus]|nr:hypothetical protein COI89_17945 [Bacillus cereus]PGU63282.1 hypothetical protein COD67_21460 [Bacillus cereus]